MSVESALYERLIGDATVGGYVGDKVFPVKAPPETAYPFVTYQMRETGTNIKDSVSPLDENTMQVDIYASGYLECKDIANAVRASLDRWNNTSEKFTMSYNDTIDAQTDMDLEIFAKSQDYTVRLTKI